LCLHLIIVRFFFILVNKKNKYRKLAKIASNFCAHSQTQLSNSGLAPWSEFETQVRIYFFLRFENCRYLDWVLKSVQYTYNRVLNSDPTSYYYIAHPVYFFFIFLQLTISSKSSLFLLQELPTGNLFFDRSRVSPYSPLLSHQRC
jgi:hypothetical protein